jgi:hypothetical protein
MRTNHQADSNEAVAQRLKLLRCVLSMMISTMPITVDGAEA